MEHRLMYRVQDLAPLLGVSRSRVYQLIAAGDLPATRRGRTIRIPRDAWEAWLEDQRDRALASVRSDPVESGRE